MINYDSENAIFLHDKSYFLNQLGCFDESLIFHDKSLKLNLDNKDALEGRERVLKKIKNID